MLRNEPRPHAGSVLRASSGLIRHAVATLARALTALAILLTGGGVLQPQLVAHAAGCDNTSPNPIVCENQQAGSLASQWDIQGSPDDAILGFTNDISYIPGQTVTFKVSTPASSYKIDIYRMGYYAGAGARLITTVTPSATLPQAQGACTTDSGTGLIDCDTWAVSATWQIPAGSVSGVYLAKLTRTDTGFTGSGQNHIPFVVRDDASHSDVVFQTSDTTWQAYNDFGGNSLYTGNPIGRAVKVSYNRPFHTNVSKPESWLFADEEPMIRFLESNGYNVSYIAGVDTDRFGATLLPNHKTFLSVGHDEYWSANQRLNVETARDQAHVNLAFLSGNESFWKTRWENSIATPGATYRTLVSYKETQSPFPHDPLEPAVGTGTWRDPRFGQDGGRPENSMTGNIFMVNGQDYRALVIPAAYTNLRFWRNTTIFGSATDRTITGGACNCVLGYEWDAEYDNGSRPAGLVDLSSSTYSVSTLMQDYGSIYGAGTATHHLTLYKAASGALVFGAGTVNYAAILDNIHSGPGTVPDASLRQATVNLLADMGAQPSSIQAGLVAATASSDAAAPTSTITSVAAGAHVQGGTDVVINGTAADATGRVGGVEVSTDNGTTWHPANGTTAWSYTWRVNTTGSATIRSRAADDSANVEVPGAGVSVTIDPAACPCTVFRATDAPAPVAPGSLDTAAVLVGTKFRSDTAGYINGIRFYKPTGATGTHTGVLWTGTGQKLATATFSGESDSGWQQASFGAPVAVSANTTYIASYFATNGGYAATLTGMGRGIDNAPLHLLRDGFDGPNGVYQYTGAVPGASPTWSTFSSANYWIDVVFNTSSVDSVPPTVISNASTSGATGLPLDATPSATFSEDIRPNTASLALKDPSGATLAGQVTYNAGTATETFTPSGPLALNTTYQASISGVQDLAGNTMVGSFTYTLSTPACPCSFWNNVTMPAEAAHPDGNAVEVGMHFRAHVDGYITGIRFYRGAPTTGSLIGNLWNSDGTQRLASVNIGPSSATGWITANFSPAVQVTPGTDYVISYFAPNGNYAASGGYFSTIDTDVGPLRAPAQVTSGGTTVTNGVYVYGGTSTFPFNPTGTNYWVDPVFSPSIGGAGVQITAQQTPTVDQTTAKFGWTTDKPSDTLLVYGTTSSYGSSSLLDTKQATAHTVQIANLAPSTSYHYQLRSRDSAGNQATSADLTFTTAAIPDTTPPTISNVAKDGENSSTRQLITWTTNEPSDTRLAYGLTTTYDTTLLLDTTTPVTHHSVDIPNLSPSTQYHFQIGSADPSHNLTTQPDDAFTTGDIQISGVNAQVASDVTGDSAATISWTSDAPATTVLDYGTTSAYGTNISVPDPVTSHTVNLTGLTPGTTYHYRVQSTANGHTAISADLTFTTSDHQPPKITNIQATQVDFTTETITWTTDEPASGEVDYSTNTSYTVIATQTGPRTTAHSITLTGLTSGTMYHFIIKSADATGNPATTGDETFTSKAQNPPQITGGPSATVTYNTAAVTWTTSVASDTQVKYGTTASYGTTSPLVSTPVTSHSVALSGLSPSTTYHYQVLSRDPNTQLLVQSADNTFTTVPAPDTTPPTISNVKPTVTTTTAVLTWTTNEIADSQVEYGLTTSYGTTTTLDKSLVTSHTVNLTGLTPNTTYFFRVNTRDSAKNLAQATGSFKTLPLPRSLSLNGSTAYAEAPNATEVNVTGDLTVETWFKDTYTVNGVASYNHLPTAILVKGDVVADKEVPFAIGIAFNQLFITEKTNWSFSYMYYDLVTNHVTPNAWHHMAFSVKASTRQATLYIDGVQVLQGTLSAVTTVGNTKPVTIGRNGAPVGYANWKGNLDDVRIWNVVRSSQDIATNYKNELQTVPTGLVGNWKFNEGTGTTAGDSTASPQNATLYGGATWSTDVHN